MMIGMRNLARPVVVLLGLFAALLLGMTPAWAHDELVSSTPADGATVSPTRQVELSFSDTVLQTGTQVQLTGPSGGVTTATTVQGSRVTATVDQPLAGGAYTVLWRVTSADGHPVSGRFGFTVSGSSASGSSSAASSSASGSSSAASSNVSGSATSSNASNLASLGNAGTESSSTSPTPPAKQTPTKKTDNYPWLVFGGVAVALVLIGVVAVVLRRRLTDDE